MSHFASFKVGQDQQPQHDPSKPNKYLKGERPEDCAFNNQQEMIEAMSSDLYATDQEYRDAVAIMVANSEFGGVTHNSEAIMSNEQKAEKRKADWLAQEDAAILKEHVQSLMNDPRYETSTLFRRQVREQIEQHQAMIEKVLPTTKGPTKINGRIQFSGDDYDQVAKGIKDEREQQRKQEAREAADAIIRQAEQQYVDVLGTPAGDDDSE